MQKSQNNFTSNILKGIRNRLVTSKQNKYKKAGLNWFIVKKLKHLPYGQEHSFNLKGTLIRFKNGPELFHSLVEIFSEDIYKTAFSTDHPYIIDCGSNIGLSVLYFQMNHPGAEIDAFEPDPSNFELLGKNVKAGKNVRLHNAAIWKEDTTLGFINDGTLDSKIGESDGAKTIQVKAVRLKNMLNRKVDLLKLDIEGAEYEVIKDCGESLKNADQLFIEFHGQFNKMNELTEILQLVEQFGYAYYIKEAANVYPTPFFRKDRPGLYDIQLNIFCFKVNQ